MPVVDKRTPPSRKRAPSAAQRNTNKNRADAAAKTQANKEKVKRAAARKAKRSENDARAAALQDTTNTAGRIGDAGLSPEEEIARLTARLKSADAQVQSLSRKNKKLSKSIRQSQGTSNADTDVTPIPKPKGKFKLQEVMGLLDDRALFTKLQAGIHALALEAKIDFKSSWSQQEPGTVAKILRVAEERHPYLSAKRFPRHWATSSILQRYINSVRAYNSGKVNPSSGVSRRRERVTHVGRLEAEAARRPPPCRRDSTSLPPDENEEMDLDPPEDHFGPTNDPPSVNDEAPVASHSSDDDDDYDKSEKWGGFGDVGKGASDSDSDGDDEELPVAND